MDGTIYSRHAHWYYQHACGVIFFPMFVLDYSKARSDGHCTVRCASKQPRKLLRVGSNFIWHRSSCRQKNIVSAFRLRPHTHLLPKAVAAIIVVIGDRVFQEKVIPTNPLTESAVVFVRFALLMMVIMMNDE